MPSLDWIGKSAVVTHHREVPFRLLEPQVELSLRGGASGNLVVEGDNLDALKALLPRYAQRVKCIYIDPPYNTGKENWVYNDAVNSPQIQAWLGQVVGKEGDTLDRHDRWLCMMYPRLALLKQFLRQDGVIMVSIDDNELQALRFLMDEIFGRKNFLAQFVWTSEGSTDNQAAVKVTHEYIVMYARDAKSVRLGYVVDPNIPQTSKVYKGFARNTTVKNGPANPPSEILLPAGFPLAMEEIDLPASVIPPGLIEAMKSEKLTSDALKARFGKVQFPLRLDPLKGSDGKLSHPCRMFSGWGNAAKLRKFIAGGFEPMVEDDAYFRFDLTAQGVPYYQRDRGDSVRNILSVLQNFGTTERMRAELQDMGLKFTYPKPVGLVKYLIRVASEPGDLVMDSFAGSGTTGQAVYELNAEGSPRNFVLVEMDGETAENVIAKRLTNVATGYKKPSGEAVQGIGGEFSYFRLSDEPLFQADGPIRSDVTFDQLAEFVWFMETGGGLRTVDGETSSPMLGYHNGKAVFLLYNGILKDRGEAGGNVLNSETLRLLEEIAPESTGSEKIVYGAGTRFGPDRLARLNIRFKQLPYELAVKSWF